jgi:hypothetical protein
MFVNRRINHPHGLLCLSEIRLTVLYGSIVLWRHEILLILVGVGVLGLHKDLLLRIVHSRMEWFGVRNHLVRLLGCVHLHQIFWW